MSVVPMKERLESEKNGRKLAEIETLCLDGCKATEIEGLSDEYTGLKTLSLIGVGLTTLAGFPALPELQVLDLSENPLAEGFEALSKCPNLKTLVLSGTPIKDVQVLAPLAECPSLEVLEMNDCALAAIENFREEIFKLLPKVVYLDGLDREGNDMSGSGKEGDEEEAEDEESSDEEENGLAALQGSKELEEDEEDYVPGEEEEDVDEGDDDDEDDEEEGDDEGDGEGNETAEIQGELANLSGAGVTGPRRAPKRAAEGAADEGEVAEAKVPAPEAPTNGDAAAETEAPQQPNGDAAAEKEEA